MHKECSYNSNLWEHFYMFGLIIKNKNIYILSSPCHEVVLAGFTACRYFNKILIPKHRLYCSDNTVYRGGLTNKINAYRKTGI